MDGIRGVLIGSIMCAALAVLALHAASAAAQDVVLDPAFGNAGIVEIPWPAGSAEANAIAVDASGRIVVGGYATGPAGDTDFSLFRLQDDGSLDPGYAADADGFRLVDFNLAGIGGKSDDNINDLATLADDSVIALGEAHFGANYSQFALTKTDTGGALDSTFADGGSAHFGFRFDNQDQGKLVKIDGAGRIVVSGNVTYTGSGGPSTNIIVGIARLTAPGQLDGDFFDNGTYVAPLWGDPGTPIRARISLVSALLFDSSQRIIVDGTFFEPYPQDIGVMRGPENGGFDADFGSLANGRVRLQLANGLAGAVAALSNGKLMVSGTFGESFSDTPFLMRLNEDGSPDANFASAGLATATAIDVNHVAAFNLLARTKSGGWLLAGQYGNSLEQIIGVILVRFNAKGIPDASFGNNGIVIIEPDADRPFAAHRAALQSDGKLVVAGSFPNSAQDATPHFAVLRILADYDTLFVNGFDPAP